jgi:AbrB family looped-hinge helix DNA binding protein
MAKKEACCDTSGRAEFQVESVITVDERGQMVLPKDLRARAGIEPGDKLALVSWEKDGAVCCMSLIKANELSGMVKSFIGPLMGADMGGDVAQPVAD